MQNLFDLSNRVAVVMGGTSGIGRAIATGLAAHGASAVPTGRRVEKINEVCCEIEKMGRPTLRHATDVTCRKSIDDLRDRVLDQFHHVDILVNAAGYTFREPVATITEEKWAALMNTNLNGALRSCQSFYEPLKAEGKGRVINIASASSYVAFTGVAAYGASKSALLALTRSLACEWAQDGISVNAIAPGVFPTELNSSLILGTPRGEEILMRTPMGRFGRVEELIGVAVLLASDGASFLTGQCIPVDGGYLASGVNQ
jgi:NAD(P)-dependent dehydrogenase (short-subunit alcohol dehydrogenase family)